LSRPHEITGVHFQSGIHQFDDTIPNRRIRSSKESPRKLDVPPRVDAVPTARLQTGDHKVQVAKRNSLAYARCHLAQT
jgi:hypothetical protein